MQNVRVFVSSPGDVAVERQRVQWIAERLSGEFAQLLRFETVLWEDAVYNAHDGGFQPQIEKRAKSTACDIVLAIFWSRLGTELPESFPERLPDGKPYPSGTAYEVLSALEARKENEHRPDVFVFRKSLIPTVPIDDKAARAEADRQWERLEEFFARYFELPDRRILRAVERFGEIGEFDRKVERLLRDWIKSNVSQGTTWLIEEKGSPFRGLEPFDPKHAEVYCGRDRKVARAIDELLIAARRGKPFLLIPGASGSGKSSLMRAGMAPRLVRPGTASGVDLWRIAVMRPANDDNPMLALARALFVTGDPKDDPGGFGEALPELASGAFKSPERLAQLFAGTTDLAADPIIAALEDIGNAETVRQKFERPLKANLLLLVDQLEDIFAANVTPEARHQFANLLAALVKSQRVWAIATLRGDMYERMITERPFIALKDICGQFDLGPPGRDELDEIVHRSAEVAGLQYEERVIKVDSTSERRERLDDRLLEDAAGENTLPLLQFALNLLFEKCWTRRQSKVLTFDAYEAIGGLDGAINQSAEIALARLVRPGVDVELAQEKEIQDEIAREINPSLEALLRKLVVPVGRDQQGAEIAAARALTARLVPLGEACRDGQSARLIDALLHARILLAPQSAQGSWLRIAHDRVITSWDRARALTEKNRDFYRVKDAIERERERWEDSNRSAEFLVPAGAQVTQAEEVVQQYSDEFSETTRSFVMSSSRRARLRQRLLKAATVVFAIVSFVATGAFYYANQQSVHAIKEEQKAIRESQRATKEEQKAIRESQRATESYATARNTAGGIVSTFVQGFKDSDGVKVKTIEEVLNKVKEAIDNLEKQSPDDPDVKRIRASMHFEFAKVFQNKRELDRALAEAGKGLEIRHQLALLPDAKPEWIGEQALDLEQVGDIRREIAKSLLKDTKENAAAQFVAARELFGLAYAIRSQLHNDDKDNPIWAVGMSQSLVRIGDLKVDADNDPAGAQQEYEHALALIVEVVRREPDNVKWQRELAWDLNKVGDILCRQNRATAGLVRLSQGLATRRYIASQNPHNTLYKRDVAFNLESIGDDKRKVKDFDGAKSALFGALELRQQLIDLDDSQTLWLMEYAETLRQIGVCVHDSGDFELAAGFFAMAADKLQPAAERDGKAKQGLLKVREAYNASIHELGRVQPLKAHDSEHLRAQADHVRNEEEVAAQVREHQARDNAVSAWIDLKAALLQPAPGQQAGKGGLHTAVKTTKASGAAQPENGSSRVAPEASLLHKPDSAGRP